MNAATTAICQICQQPIERLTDRIYVNWGTKGSTADLTFAQPNHKVCAQARYARNQKMADGYVECVKCNEWVLDLTANRLGGQCRQCAEQAEAQQTSEPEVTSELMQGASPCIQMACGCVTEAIDTTEDLSAEEASCNACLKAIAGWAQEDITLQACCLARYPEDDLEIEAWRQNADHWYRLMDERGY